MSSSEPSSAFIGLGNMGVPMARAAGGGRPRPCVGFDISDEARRRARAEAGVVESAEVAVGARVTILMLRILPWSEVLEDARAGVDGRARRAHHRHELFRAPADPASLEARGGGPG